ncbi:YkgJ family cysteine cluster protein [Thermodesulfobacteriota bacterium]
MRETTPPSGIAEWTLLESHDAIDFSCHRALSCFNACCHDLNQFLTPYDILRLKNRLALPSGVFLKQYTSIHTGPRSGMPVVSLKPRPASTAPCPFVTDSGCAVYEDRPSSCRAYPLARVVSRDRDTGAVREGYFLIEESHCLGFGQENSVSISKWVARQGLEAYNTCNDLFLEVVALKNRAKPGPISSGHADVFVLGCYDLDRFRDCALRGDLPGPADILDAVRATPGKDQEGALLKLGLRWASFMICEEPVP